MSYTPLLTNRINLHGRDDVIATKNLIKWINLGIGRDRNVALGTRSQVKFRDYVAGTPYIGYNVGVGYECLYYNQNSQFNVAIGHECMRGGESNDGGQILTNEYTESNRNVAIGYQCAQFIGNNAFDNVLIGYQCAYSNYTDKFTGDYNVIIGSQSGFSITSGSNNIGIGYQNLYSTTTGSGNVGIGNGNGYSNTTGNYNTAMDGKN